MNVVFRADQGGVLFYTQDGGKGIIHGHNLKSLYRWIKTNEKDEYVNSLMASGILHDTQKESLLSILKKCTVIQAPLHSLAIPEQIQVELTTRCPIRCPQCFCDLNGKDIDKEILFSLLRKAAWLKIPYISLSGGEPLIYPHLTETIKYANDSGLYTALATSGVGLTKEFLGKIKNAGLNEFFISLNGSTEEVNSKSRDAYHETVEAMKLLKKTKTPYFVNWVAREDNIDDLPEMTIFCRELGAKKIVALVLKPDSDFKEEQFLRKNSFLKLADFLKTHDHSCIPVQVESCFSAIHSYLLGEQRAGLIGCEAGRTVMSINVEGEFSPCRHIPLSESFGGIKDYWYQSGILKEIRNSITNIKEPCASCKYGQTCIACRGNSYKLYNDPCAGQQNCMVPMT